MPHFTARTAGCNANPDAYVAAGAWQPGVVMWRGEAVLASGCEKVATSGRHDRKIAAIQQLILAGMKMVVANEKLILELF